MMPIWLQAIKDKGYCYYFYLRFVCESRFEKFVRVRAEDLNKMKQKSN